MKNGIARLAACALIGAMPLGAWAVEKPPVLAPFKERRDDLKKAREANEALFFALLADGQAQGIWTAEEREAAEDDFKSNQQPSWKLLAPPALEPRVTLPLQLWIRESNRITERLIGQVCAEECSAATRYAEEVWCRAEKLEDLAPAVAFIAAVRQQDPEKWNVQVRAVQRALGLTTSMSSNSDSGLRFGMPRNSIVEAIQALSVVGSGDGFLPPDPMVDTNAYLRWREVWKRLDEGGFTFVRAKGPAARFAALEARHRDLPGMLDGRLVELLARNAPLAELDELFKPLWASAPFDDRGPRPTYPVGVPTTAGSMSLEYGQFLPRERGGYRTGRPQEPFFSPQDAPIVGLMAVHELRRAEEGHDEAAIQAVKQRINGYARTFSPPLARLLRARVAQSAEPTDSSAPKASPLAIAGAATAELLARLEAPPAPKPAIKAVPRKSDLLFESPPRLERPSTDRSLTEIAATIRSLEKLSESLNEPRDQDAWRRVLEKDFALIALRDQAAREQLAGLLKVDAATLDVNAPLSILWERACESAVKGNRNDEGRQLVRMANTFGVMPLEQARAWDLLFQQFGTEPAPGAGTVARPSAFREILTRSTNPVVVQRARECFLQGKTPGRDK